MSGYRGTRKTPVAVIKMSNASSSDAVVNHHRPSRKCADVTSVPNRMCGRIPRSVATCLKYEWISGPGDISRDQPGFCRNEYV
jgi:hypothetical protein